MTGRARWLASARTPLPLTLALVALTSGAQYSDQGPPPDSGLYLVPNALMPLLGDGATPVHQYRDSLLASVPALETLPRRVQSRITAVQDTGSVFFRELERSASPWSREDVEGHAEGDYLVAFWGPIDPAWRAALSSLGLVVLDNAAPYALPFDTGDGPVKGYVWPSFGTGALYVATTSRVTAIVDEGATATEKVASDEHPLSLDASPHPWNHAYLRGRRRRATVPTRFDDLAAGGHLYRPRRRERRPGTALFLHCREYALCRFDLGSDLCDTARPSLRRRLPPRGSSSRP